MLGVGEKEQLVQREQLQASVGCADLDRGTAAKEAPWKTDPQFNGPASSSRRPRGAVRKCAGHQRPDQSVARRYHSPGASAPRVVLALASAAMVHASELGAVHTIAGGPYEASGAVQSPDGKGILFVDDNRPDVVFWMKLRTDESLAAPPISVPIGVQGSDRKESPRMLRMSTSSARSREARGARARTSCGFASMAPANARREPRRSKTSGRSSATRSPRMARAARKSELNIEGLAWDAKGARLLLGLRAPLDDSGRALALPLKLRTRGKP